MRPILAAALLACCAAAQAQTPPAATTSTDATTDRAAKMAQAKEKFDARFAEADANHDGQLTLDEAKSKMPVVAKNFTAIDTNKDGLVTKEEIGLFMRSKMAERQAAPAQ